MKEPEEPKERVKVVDRRSFTAEGERRQPDASERASSTAAPPPDPGQTLRGEGFEARPAGPAGPTRPEKAFEAVQFSSFVISLASTAFIHLGEIEDPVTARRGTDLDAARQMIDILDMLRSKTQGNLDPAEQELIEGVLFELKLKYSQKAPASPARS